MRMRRRMCKNCAKHLHFFANPTLENIYMPTASINVYAKKYLRYFFLHFLLFCANPPHMLTHAADLQKNSRRSATLRLKKSLYCALYKGFPAAGGRHFCCLIPSPPALSLVAPLTVERQLSIKTKQNGTKMPRLTSLNFQGLLWVEKPLWAPILNHRNHRRLDFKFLLSKYA